MDSDRPPPPPPPHHHRSTTTSDLFICFTSRHHHHHSSSSMKIPSKSILSPNRTTTTNRDPPFSLTTSLSRRLRTNRSIKGAASPAMFPTTGKKRASGSGPGFDNPEPSSPKVTCIGQVRIKSKKKHGKQQQQKQQLRSLSRRHSTGDVSFRKLNLGSGSFNNNERNGSNNSNNNNQRWVHLPLTICEALRAFGSEFSCLFPCRSNCFSPVRERERRMTSERDDEHSSCAAVFTRWLVAFDDGGTGGRRDVELVVQDNNNNNNINININNNINNVNEYEEDEEERMFRASRRHVFDDLEIVNNRIQGSVDEARVSICIPPKNALLLMRCRSDPLKMEALANRLWESTLGQHDDDQDDDQDEEFADYKDEIQANDDEREQAVGINDENEDEGTFFGSLFDEIVDEDEQNDDIEEVKGVVERSEMESKERERVLEREGLPECLLLMMYEPKLSMEVSKETWVSSKDFIRRQPSRKKPPAPPPPPVKPAGSQSTASTTTTATTTTKDTLPNEFKYNKHEPASGSVQPGRSSCSLPAPSSMAEMLEQKLVNAVGYEPFVLSRCKSEPLRTAAAKLAPDNCFWKNRKLEPLRRASFGIGAAGVGF